MRFPSRPVLTASVLAALAASAGTVLTMPDQVADAAESGPTALPGGPGVHAQEPSQAPTAAGPPVTGAQIAGLALAPARERAGTLIAERAAAQSAADAAEEKARQEAAQQEQADQNQHRRGGNDWEEFRRQLHQACQDGRVRGQICRGA